jgi:hypothetical protein
MSSWLQFPINISERKYFMPLFRIQIKVDKNKLDYDPHAHYLYAPRVASIYGLLPQRKEKPPVPENRGGAIDYPLEQQQCAVH